MQGYVSGATPFKALKECFCVGATTSGYTLNYSTSRDGVYTAYEQSTPANENLIVTGVVPYMWFKLVDNVDSNTEIIL